MIRLCLLRFLFPPSGLKLIPQVLPSFPGTTVMAAARRDRTVGELNNDRASIGVVGVPATDGKNPFLPVLIRKRTDNVRYFFCDPFRQVEGRCFCARDVCCVLGALAA